MADPPEKFRSHVPAMIASTCGALLSAAVGSHLFGIGGTTAGLVVGSGISGTISWWTERAIRRSQEVAKAKLLATKRVGRKLSANETQYIEKEAIKKFDHRQGGFQWRVAAIIALTGLAACAVTILLLNRAGVHQVASFTPAPRPTVTRTIIPQQTVTQTSSPVNTPSNPVTPSESASAAPTADSTPTPSADSSPQPFTTQTPQIGDSSVTTPSDTPTTDLPNQ